MPGIGAFATRARLNHEDAKSARSPISPAQPWNPSRSQETQRLSNGASAAARTSPLRAPHGAGWRIHQTLRLPTDVSAPAPRYSYPLGAVGSLPRHRDV